MDHKKSSENLDIGVIRGGMVKKRFCYDFGMKKNCNPVEFRGCPYITLSELDNKTNSSIVT